MWDARESMGGTAQRVDGICHIERQKAKMDENSESRGTNEHGREGESKNRWSHKEASEGRDPQTHLPPPTLTTTSQNLPRIQWNVNTDR